MPADRATNELIRSRCFSRGGQLARGELALETALEDEALPDPVAWLVRSPDEDGGVFAETYLLGDGGDLYRLRASTEGGPEDDPSECACDFIRLGRDARFSLAVVRRWAGDDPNDRTRTLREIVRTWTFNFGTGEPLVVRTSSLDDRRPEDDAFARALASSIANAR